MDAWCCQVDHRANKTEGILILVHTIVGFEIWRCQLPTGRTIGDCTCHYDAEDVFILALNTDDGLVGWGFGETVSTGVFTKPAPWLAPMPAADQLRQNFAKQTWPLMQQCELAPLWERRQQLFPGFSYQSVAVRTALWDLMAKSQHQPLHKLLGSTNDHVRAYGSGLDFPLTDAQAEEVFRRFTERGFTAVKVKVGDPRPERDLHRLQFVREVVGENVEIAIDANEAWTCDQAIERITFYTREGVRLSYVEDALSREDLDGFVRLNASVDVDIIGHDYILDHRELRRFAERGAFSRLRVSADIDHALACAEIAREFGLPLIFGNSLFEFSVHAAAAVSATDRIEFSDLAWNRLPALPVEFVNGYAIAPSRPGHGLEPSMDALAAFSKLPPGSAW
jgi:L-alanine-DL-glutamate epimerase-like enolase superfamily enzyme